MSQLILITGGTSGIGRAAAFSLAAAGHEVLVCGRLPQRLDATLAELRAAHPDAKADGVLGDLSTLGGMRSVVAQVRGRTDRLDAIVNNAGALFTSRRLTTDGLEQTLALNHLAPFVLTCELSALLAPGSRVVTTSSSMHRLGRLDPDDLQAEGVFVPPLVYATSKLANVLFTRELARRMRSREVGAHCVHPGVTRSGFGRSDAWYVAAVWRALGPALRSPERAAATLVTLAAEPQPLERSGGYWVDGARVAPHRKAQDDELAGALWRRSAELTGSDLTAAVAA
jgi:NAD(P)-dependent dehydrogenase (short-subunit alcohol dehydrogenase family)